MKPFKNIILLATITNWRWKWCV